MIHAHVIAKSPATPMYQAPDMSSGSTCSVIQGAWLGVLEDIGEWIHVISSHCEGWVKKDQVTNLSPMQLHIMYSPGKPIEYIAVA